MNKLIKLILPLLIVVLSGSPISVLADIAQASKMQQQNGVLQDYRRLLPLEGGSNFRDMGGYPTIDGKTVKRGLLFRSGAMSSLSEHDMDYLGQLGFESVVELRSEEELELYPNQWVKARGINYHVHAYSITDLLSAQSLEDFQNNEPGAIYRALPYTIVPQLKGYFSLLADGQAPLVVNCSAGQDRTGIASSLLLTALGVPRELVIEDYLLSSDFRRPDVERGDVDLESYIATNAFAAMIAPYYDEIETHAPPLVTPDGVPYIQIAFDQIEQDYGTIENFMLQELDVDAADIARLKKHYLK